jgi:drug/metabolite transporter (DMT)-like permease
MNWVLLAIIPPLLFSISNYIDKLLVGKAGGESSGGLFILSGAAGIITIPVLLFFAPTSIFSVSFYEGVLLLLQGALFVLYLIPYFKALQQYEPSVVVPLFHLVTVISLVLEYVFLGTMISGLSFVGLCLVIGASLEIGKANATSHGLPTRHLFFLMLISSTFMSLSFVIFKGVAQDINFWSASCYGCAGGVFAASVAFVVRSDYRRDFLRLLGRRPALLGLNLFNEFLAIVSGLIQAFCFTVLAAPIAIVNAISGLQPLIVFVIGVFLTLFFPKLHVENLDRPLLRRKVTCIFIIIIGATLISLENQG